MEVSRVRDDAVLTVVMHDVGECLVPPGHEVVLPAQHARSSPGWPLWRCNRIEADLRQGHHVGRLASLW